MDLAQHPDAVGFEFPTDTVLIAFGPATADFRARLDVALAEANAVRTPDPVTTRESSGGRFLAVHIPVHVQSRDELETLYRAIASVPGVRFRL
jgi:uncharacterized protein